MMMVDQWNKQIKLMLKLLDIVVSEHGWKMDNKNTYFYDQLLAFHKSIGASDPDATIF